MSILRERKWGSRHWTASAARSLISARNGSAVILAQRLRRCRGRCEPTGGERHRIHPAAGGKPGDDAHRPRRIILRRCEVQDGCSGERSRGGCYQYAAEEFRARSLRNLSECVLYVETEQFAADRINVALGATAGIFPDQPSIIATVG
jgi:hypothetical protein